MDFNDHLPIFVRVKKMGQISLQQRELFTTTYVGKSNMLLVKQNLPTTNVAARTTIVNIFATTFNVVATTCVLTMIIVTIILT